MLDNSITITYDSESVVVNRIDWGRWSGDDAAGNEYLLEIKHIQPKDAFADGVRQHLCKITRYVYTLVDGVRTLTDKTSTHEVIRSDIGQQDDTICTNLSTCLHAFVTAERSKVLDFRS